jgi:hypothetical protein
MSKRGKCAQPVRVGLARCLNTKTLSSLSLSSSSSRSNYTHNSLFSKITKRGQKQGQVAVFIIVGLLVLALVIAGYMLFNQTVVDTKPSFVIQTIPQSPLQEYVQACLHITLEDALLRLGEQGGYVDMPQSVRLNPQRSISVDPNRNYAVPYWVYGYNSYVPSISQMETQVGEFIDRQILSCLGQFGGLNEQITVLSSPKTNVTFYDADVVVVMTYNVRASNLDVSTNFEEFTYVYRAPIKETLESAIRFAYEISSSTYLSEMTINLMALSDPIVPMTNLKFTCEKPVWSKNQVRADFEEILYYNIPKLRILGAEFAPFEAPTRTYQNLQRIGPDDFMDGATPYGSYGDIPSDTYEYAHMYYQSRFASDYTNAKVKIYARYLPEYDLYLDARPSQGDMMMGTTTKGAGKYLNFFCLNMYHFTYDVRYPIEFSFYKENGLIDKPFIIRFALPVQVESNLPVRSNELTTLVSDMSYSEELCIDTKSEEIFISARDITTGFDIPGANVTFGCVKYSCDLGETKLDVTGKVMLRTQLPSGCYGGLLEISKPGYISQTIQTTDATYTYDVDMVPIQPILYRVVLGPNRAGIMPTQLKTGENAVVMVEDLYSDYSESFTFDPNSRNALYVIRGASVYNVTVLVYDGSQLAAGYKGELRVDQSNLGQQLILYTKEYIPRLKNEELIQLWDDIENPDIMVDYAPAWQ